MRFNHIASPKLIKLQKSFPINRFFANPAVQRNSKFHNTDVEAKYSMMNVEDWNKMIIRNPYLDISTSEKISKLSVLENELLFARKNNDEGLDDKAKRSKKNNDDDELAAKNQSDSDSDSDSDDDHKDKKKKDDDSDDDDDGHGLLMPIVELVAGLFPRVAKAPTPQ